MRYCIVFTLCILYGCNTSKPLDIQGHRGYRGLYPENSLPAFNKALDLNVTTLELDLTISKDHKLVVSHEPFMSHEIALDLFGNMITLQNEMSFNLYAMPYDSIKLYDCGSKKHPRFPFQKNEKVHKPLLTEVIDLAEEKSNNSVFYNIEIKSKVEYDGIYTPELKTFVSLVIEVLKTKGITDRAILQSFDIRALETIKIQNPDIQIALLIDEDELIAIKLENYRPYFKLLNEQVVLKYQDNGLKVIPWTVNDVEDINTMLKLKVDGIISDFPDRVIELNNKKSKEMSFWQL